MNRDFRLTCLDCKHQWIGRPFDLVYPEKCPECGSEVFEVGAEYQPSSIQAFWILLLVPNLLIFLS
jgi:Zn finger protein HypA/HybF involved in hydrogenase expression